MPAPAKEKTWQYSNNNGLFFGATLIDTLRLVMFQIKTSLTGFASNPWTVSGSSNSSASGMDAVDRWASAAGLVWAAGARSWIVLRQAGIATKFEICIDLNTAASNTITLVVSPVNGFGTANAGTNGSTSARPTATDEVVLFNSAAWTYGSSNNIAWVHAQQSSDGQCTRVFQASSNLIHSTWIFDRVKNPNPGWTGTPAVFSAHSANGLTSSPEYTGYHDIQTRANIRHGAVNGNVFFATPGFNSAAFGRTSAGAVPHDVSKEWPMTPITLWSETTLLRGMWGNLYDLYWGSDDLNTQITYEAGGVPHAWAQFGTMIFPWNGTIPRIG
jgi:hypothetical protein